MIRLRSLVYWSVALILDIWAVYLVMTSPMWQGLLVHVIAAGCFFGAIERASDLKARAWVQALLVGLMPVFGILSALMVEVITTQSNREGIAEEFQEQVRRTAVHADIGTSAAFSSDRIREQIDVMPLEETLDGDDFMLKRQALDRLARRATPRSVNLLRRALEDPHPDIRFYASGALSRIETRVANLVRDAENDVKRDPDDAQARRTLGNRYFDYVYMGLVEKALRGEYRDRAIAAFQKSLEIDPDQPDVLVRLARALLERGDWEEARVGLDRALTLDPGLTQAWLWRAETHFMDGNLDDAAEDCRRAIDSGNVPEAVDKVMSWLSKV